MGDDVARSPFRVVANPGSAYDDDHRLWQGIPSIERTPGGKLFVAWYSGDLSEGDAGNYCLAATSDDAGHTWSPPVLVVEGEPGVRAGEPLPWLDPQGRLWLFWNGITLDPELRGTWAIRTNNPDDPQPVWSEPRFIANGIVLGKPLVLKSGEWLIPLDVRNGTPLSREVGEHVGGAIVSTDAGESWSWRGGFTLPPDIQDFDEHCIVERDDGSLWTLIRVKPGLLESSSRDGGRTWSTPTLFMANARTRACLLRLASGNLLLIYHDGPGRERDGETFYDRSHLTAFLSTDGGASFRKKLLLDPRRVVSYPDATQGPDGRIYITYDYNRYITGCKEVLFASITEDQILRGLAPATPTVVNRAIGIGNTIELQRANRSP